MFFRGQFESFDKACGNYFKKLLKYFEIITQNMLEKNQKMLNCEKNKLSNQQYTVICFSVAFFCLRPCKMVVAILECVNINRFNIHTSSHGRCSLKKDFLKYFAKFAGKHVCLRPETLLKNLLWYRRFLVIFTKFVRTSFFKEHLRTTASEYI